MAKKRNSLREHRKLIDWVGTGTIHSVPRVDEGMFFTQRGCVFGKRV